MVPWKVPDISRSGTTTTSSAPTHTTRRPPWYDIRNEAAFSQHAKGHRQEDEGHAAYLEQDQWSADHDVLDHRMSRNTIKAVDARSCSWSTVREMVARMHLLGGGKAFKPEARGDMLSSESTLDLTI